MEDLRREIEQIKERNKRVESEKAWEKSIVRKVLVATFTYLVVLSFFFVIKADRPFINALVPTGGYLLSTMSLPFFKSLWLKLIYKANY